MRVLARSLGITLVAAVAALAQDSPRDTAIARALETVEGRRIRVALLSSRWVGHFDRVNGDTLYFGNPQDRPMAIRFNAIDTLWVHDDARRGGAWVGGIAGMLVGGYAGFAVVVLAHAEGGSPVRVNDSMVKGALAGAALAGIGGLLIGEFIGKRTSRWRRVYP